METSRALLYVTSLLAFLTQTVCRAEGPVCVLKGSSKWLDVPEYQDLQFNTMFWNFNNDESVLEYSHKFKDLTVYKAFKDKVEFSQTNFSLLLKNMQAGDSGLYTAKITDANGKIKHVAKHRLSVKEAVPKPQVKVELLSSGGGYCNVSVNCSAKDTWATYTCDHTHCTQVQSTPSPSAINITVTATNGSILCESSNCASTSNQSASMEDHCTKVNSSNGVSKGVIIGVIIVVIGVTLVIVGIIVIKKYWHSGGSTITQSQCLNTEYASVEGPGIQNGGSFQLESAYDTVNTPGSQRPPEGISVYATVGQPGHPPDKPESVYATVNKRS
ncbi:hypothetical protein AGOR_G00031900 [Albula goreensis]|uniref:Immunoglobulin V-set domain-containing protein n=1 Tax=Albula goreensis TaxID=1534307 RepID=A0A8T3E3L4_9TELE|nr:hypothetical protein AGOR_G00031900 [Albula goreensis]